MTTEGALLRVKGEWLRVEAGEDLLANIHLNRVRQVVCQGRAGVTSTLPQRFIQRRIDLVRLYENGGYAGRLTPPTGTEVNARLAQYRSVGTAGAALRIARRIVAGKITNMRTGLLRAARFQEQPQIAEHAERLAAARQAALTADHTTSLLGCEGAATDIADDERRDDVSLFLSGYGPRLQLSVLEVELPSADTAAKFRDRLRNLIDPDDDQIRLTAYADDDFGRRVRAADGVGVIDQSFGGRFAGPRRC